MSHPLDGARLKVVRAQEHLRVLKRKIFRYLKTDMHTVTPIQNDAGGWGVDAKIVRDPNPCFSAIIGDCLSNSRAALDYIAWEVAGTYFTERALDPRKDKIYFPIRITPKECKERLDGLRKYKIPDPVLAEIAAVQPYNAGYRPLWILSELVNADKHRLPIVVRGDFHIISLSVSRLAPRGKFPPEPAWIRHEDPQVKAQASVYVAWEDVSMPREPVERTLTDIVELVANIVPRFDRFCI